MILFERPNVTTGSTGGGSWGEIDGSIDDQADLTEALDAKADATALDGITFAIVGSYLHATKSATTRKIRLLDL